MIDSALHGALLGRRRQPEPDQHGEAEDHRHHGPERAAPPADLGEDTADQRPQRLPSTHRRDDHPESAGAVGPVERFELFTGHLSERNLRMYERAGYRRTRTAEQTPTVSLVYLEKAAGRPVAR